MSISEKIKDLQERRWELLKLQGRLKLEEAAFEEKILPLKQDIQQASYEVQQLGSETVSVVLIDLVFELSRLTSVPLNQMNVKLKLDNCIYGKIEKEEVASILGRKMILSISGDKASDSIIGQPLYYYIAMPFDPMSIQRDGKTLLEHCNIKYEHNSLNGMNYTNILINKCIEDVICTFTLEDLAKDDEITLYSVGILREAVLNCLTKENKVKTL